MSKIKEKGFFPKFLKGKFLGNFLKYKICQKFPKMEHLSKVSKIKEKGFFPKFLKGKFLEDFLKWKICQKIL